MRGCGVPGAALGSRTLILSAVGPCSSLHFSFGALFTVVMKCEVLFLKYRPLGVICPATQPAACALQGQLLNGHVLNGKTECSLISKHWESNVIFFHTKYFRVALANEQSP